MTSNTTSQFPPIKFVRHDEFEKIEDYAISKKRLSVLLENNFDEIAEESAERNWDGYNAVPVDKFTIDLAKEFLNELPQTLIVPEMSAEPDGELAFDWYVTSNKRFSMSINSIGRVTYAGELDGKKVWGTEYFYEQIADVILQYLVIHFNNPPQP